MTWSESLTQYAWVAGGALVTLALGIALLYWIDQEWSELDRKQRQSTTAPLPHPPGDTSGTADKPNLPP